MKHPQCPSAAQQVPRSGPPASSATWRRVRKAMSWGVPAVLLAAALVAAFSLNAEQYETVIDQLQGPWRSWALLVLLIGAGLMAVGLPGTIVSVGSGVVFGFALGYPLAVLLAFLAAVLTYAVGRRLGDGSTTVQQGDAVEDGWLATVQRSVESSDWRFVMLLRLTPVLPYALINYSLGRCGVSWSSYAVGTAAGLLPGTAAHVYLGAVGMRLVGGGELHPVEWALIVIGIITVPLTGWILVRKIKREAGADSAAAEPPRASDIVMAGR